MAKRYSGSGKVGVEDLEHLFCAALCLCLFSQIAKNENRQIKRPGCAFNTLRKVFNSVKVEGVKFDEIDLALVA